MPRNKRLNLTFPLEKNPNGDLADPSIVRVGCSFQVNWAFVNANPECYVYEVYDKHHRLVYVGVTNDFATRWGAHLGSSWWARSVDIDFVLLRGYPSRFEARVVEALTINEHRPPCNVKPEQKYFRIGSTRERPFSILTAELVPTRKF